MKLNICRSAWTFIAVLMAMTGSVSADEIAEKGRAILEANKQTIITVQLVIKEKFSFGGSDDEGSESKSEVPGTVISADGLTVVSLMSTDPGSMFADMMGDFASPVDSDFDMDFDMSSELVSVKLLPDGGKEIPAAVVLRDKDLDLAFIRPLEKPSQPMPFLNLADGSSPKILDQVIGISRLGKVGGRVPSVTPSRIQAVVEKPRTFYVSSGYSMGTPAFSMDGKVIGIEVMRMIKSSDGGMGVGSMMGGDGMLPVIVPASDVAEVAAQAPEKAEEVTPAEANEKSEFIPKKKREASGAEEEKSPVPEEEKK